MLGLLLDVIVVLIVVLAVYSSAKHGFVRTLIEVAGFAAAFLIAFTVSSPLADVTYDKIVEPSIISTAQNAVDEGDRVAEKLWDALPGLVKNGSADFGFSKDSFTRKVDTLVTDNASTSAVKISDNVLKPVITKIFGVFYSTVIVIAIIILTKVLAVWINKMFSFSVIGKVNAFLGGVVGVFKGVGFAVIFCMIISILIIVFGEFFPFTAKNINSSNLFKILYGFSPFV